MEHLPAGVINPTGPIRNEPTGQDVSYLVQLLGYIEQQGIAAEFNVAAGAYADVNAGVRAQQVPTFRCPSDPLRGAQDDTVAVSNYAGCHHDEEALIDKDNMGLLFLNSKIRYGDITDGATNTIMVGELMPTYDSFGWTSGTSATLRNTGSTILAGGTTADMYEPVDPNFVGGFGSRHQGGAQFCLGDGSIRFFTQSIDPILYRNLGNRADGAMMGEKL